MALGIDLHGDFHSAGGCAVTDGLLLGFPANADDIVVGGVGDGAFHHVTNHGQGHADGGDHGRVFGNTELLVHGFRQVGNNGGSTAAAAHKTGGAGVHLVILHQLRGDLTVLLRGEGQHLAGGFLNGATHVVRQRLPGFHGGLFAAGGVVAFLHIPGDVRGAGHGQGHPDTVAALDAGILRVGRHGTHGNQLRLHDQVGVGIDFIVESRNVGTSGAGGDCLSVLDLNHGAAADTNRAHVQRVEVGLMPADLRVLDHHLAVLDTGDIGGGTTDLEENTVGQLFVHQRAGDTRGRAGQNGQNGTAADLIHRHNAAIAAHDHQRAGNSGSLDAVVGHGRGFQHFGHDGGIDDSGTGTDAQAVELGNVVGRGGGKILLGADLHGQILVGRVIHAERLGRHKRGGALLSQILHSSSNGSFHIAGRVGILIFAGQEFAGSQFDLSHGGVGLALGTLDPGTDSDDAHVRHITFQQCVCGLGRSVGDKRHIFGGNAVFFHDSVQNLHDTRCHALFGRVGSGDLYRSDQLVSIVVNGDGVRKGASHINTDSDFHCILSFA